MELNITDVKITNKTNILEIEVPAEMEINKATGMPAIDRLYSGDGITPSTAALITGMPGAGKSTLMMQLADSMTAQGHVVLYNTKEESLYQVRRVTKRLSLQNGFYVGQHKQVESIIQHLAELKEQNQDKQIVLIQDSLQCLELQQENKKGRPLSGARGQLLSLAKLIEWAKETFGIMFIIGQVNKKGDFAGKNDIKHMIDCHMHLGYELKPNGDEVPCVEMTKNRFGISGLYYNFELTESGVNFKRS